MNTDVAILQSIDDTLKDSPEASQRIIARNAKLSVGMMNAILKRFVERGWIMIKNVNGCKLSYALTPEGMSEIYERGRSFAARTFAAVNDYNDILNKLVENARKDGKIRVVIYGPSNLRFLIVYTCERYGMQLEERGTDECQLKDDEIGFIGEMVGTEIDGILKKAGAVSLVDLGNLS